jgi:cysteine-rich repeat protein
MQINRIAYAAAALSLLVSAAPARAATIDFEELNEGDIVGTVTVDGTSVSVSGSNPAFPGQNAAMIFDSSCPGGCSGQDPDLGSPNQDFGGPGVGAGGELGSPNQNDTALGNVLIVSEDLDSNDPDDADNANESVTIDFSAFGTVTLSSMDLIDVEAEEPNAVIELLDAADAVIATIIADPTGDNGTATIGLGPTAGVAKMVVTLNGSGGIDNIVFDQDAVCGNGQQEEGEECDGTDAAACGDSVCRDDCTCSECGDGVLDRGEECDDGNNADGDGCSATCDIEEQGGEGCTPGYWKALKHLDSWQGVAPGDNFNTTFGTSATFSVKDCGTSNPTLLQALKCGGGGLSALGRHAVAALLNSLNGGVEYGFSAADVKAVVQQAIASGNKRVIEAAKDELADQNELGCPLN